MRHLLFSTPDLAVEIVERIQKSETTERNNAPALTRDIFGPDALPFPELLKTEEFVKVCSAIDLLIEEGNIFFNGETGELRLLGGSE
jgi:hypothetical protein